MPHSKINTEALPNTLKIRCLWFIVCGLLFVVYCWGPGCNGATKAALKISALGYGIKEMLGGIHYWKYCEKYPVNRRMNE